MNFLNTSASFVPDRENNFHSGESHKPTSKSFRWIGGKGIFQFLFQLLPDLFSGNPGFPGLTVEWQHVHKNSFVMGVEVPLVTANG